MAEKLLLTYEDYAALPDDGRRYELYEGEIEGPPDLVIELLSPSTAARDRAGKARLYARYGVRHYWLVDPDARRVECLELEGAAYTPRGSLAGDGVLESGLFPGLPINGAMIWE